MLLFRLRKEAEKVDRQLEEAQKTTRRLKDILHKRKAEVGSFIHK